MRSPARDLRHSRRHELGTEMVQAERRVETGAAYAGARPDLRAGIVVGTLQGIAARRRRTADLRRTGTGATGIVGQARADIHGFVAGDPEQENEGAGQTRML